MLLTKRQKILGIGRYFLLFETKINCVKLNDRKAPRFGPVGMNGPDRA